MEEHYDEHYKSEHQPIEVMQANMTNDELIGFLRGNIIKYALRFGRKDDTKKETEADIKYTLVKNDGEKAKVINIPKNIEKTHPYTTTEVIKKIKETLELSLGQNHGFTSNKFQDICKRKGIKSNQDYCYQFTYSKNTINKYNDLAIEYISQIYIDEYKKQKSCE